VSLEVAVTGGRPQAVTGLLQAWARGDKDAAERVFPLVYDQLRRLAARQLRGERRGHTLQPTALVHEAYLRLAGQRAPDWPDRAHFFAMAARVMRHVLVDHARRNRAAKRGGSACRVSLEEATAPDRPLELEVIALDEALTELQALDADQAHIVELRFFGGLTEEEAAAALGVSVATVQRDWRTARAWLYRRIAHGRGGGAQRTG
jgi:RNA polymerase sigma factor (TIGR02999 family)